jgi:hypothetical protein
MMALPAVTLAAKLAVDVSRELLFVAALHA